jgi:hypothetical protein
MPSLRQSLRRATLALLVSTLVPATASRADAQELFGNPFLTAEALRLQRGDAPNATLRLRYQVSGDPNAEEARGALVIEVAADWAYVRRSNRQTLYDFRLGRVLDMRDGTFVSRNMVGDVAFRVYERQNRAYLTGVMRSAGGKSPVDGCDAETELGAAVPALKEAADAKVGAQRRRSSATAVSSARSKPVPRTRSQQRCGLSWRV